MKKEEIHKTITKPLTVIVRLAVWVTTVLVSLAVGFSMIEGGALNQSIPFISNIWDGLIVAVAGWIVIVLTVLSIVLAIIDRM